LLHKQYFIPLYVDLFLTSCDGRRDCKTGEDEKDCGNTTRKSSPFHRHYYDDDDDDRDSSSGGCTSEYKWECANGTCIPRLWLCDAHLNCHAKSDEKDCPPAGCAASKALVKSTRWLFWECTSYTIDVKSQPQLLKS
jgi:hypothetical protein